MNNKAEREVVVIAHNMRSTHNVGSLLRTADGLGVNMVYLTGYTPYPKTKNDERLPHISSKLTNQIHKTALGAEKTDIWQHKEDVVQLINDLRRKGFTILGLEQADGSIILNEYKASASVALLLGSEVEGIDSKILSHCDEILEIPMLGTKESLNVIQAAAIALYHLQFN